MDQDTCLKHHFLVAMPHMSDPWFAHSVCYICDHDENGSMGLVINKPINMSLTDIFAELNMSFAEQKEMQLRQGGPVNQEQGFILYQGDFDDAQNIQIAPNVRLSTSKDILQSLAENKGPKNIIACLGYAGWEAGQLENEIANNGWLTVPADETLLFHTPVMDIAQAAAKKLGIDINLLSQDAGHA